jgi:hypothetical protein
MGMTAAKGGLPPRWGLVQEQGPGTARRVLWFGPQRIALDDIAAVTADEVRERPIAGLAMGACVFMLVAMILAYGVFENGWRERFLLGTVFLALLGLAGLYDSSTIKAQRYFEVKIATTTRGILTFASADAGEVEALLTALAGAGIRR